jgi:hypothetical protein
VNEAVPTNLFPWRNTMNHLALLLVLTAPATATAATPSIQRPSLFQPQPDLSDAERLFREGQTKYDSADYEGAIESFTKALGEATAKGSKEFQVRGLLLYNIGKTHIRAYEIDHDLAHLRQARAIYKRFIKEADVEAMFEKFSGQDVADARTELRMLEMRIEGLESVDQPVPPPPVADKMVQEPALDWKKPRNIGIGLTASGSVALATGIGLLVYGSQFRPHAESQVAKLDGLGVPLDHPARLEGMEYTDAETSRGRTWMAVGGSVVAVGLVGAGVGVAHLVKSKKLKEGRVQPSVALSPGYTGIVLSGRF